MTKKLGRKKKNQNSEADAMTIEEERVRLGFLILGKIIQFPQNSYRGQIFVCQQITG